MYGSREETTQDDHVNRILPHKPEEEEEEIAAAQNYNVVYYFVARPKHGDPTHTLELIHQNTSEIS